MACKTITYDVNTVTRADRIRSMSDEELAEQILKIQNDALAEDSPKYDLDYLRQPAEE